MMTKTWQTLSTMTGGAPIEIERVRLFESDVAIEGRFELPPMARLTAEDQVFVAAFVRCHGSIKQMEKFFGVSYPTIKNRLNRIGALLPFAEVEPEPEGAEGEPGKGEAAETKWRRELLYKLQRGETNVRDVLAQLRTKS